MEKIDAVDGTTAEWPAVHPETPNLELVKEWPEDWWYWSNLVGDLWDPHTGKDIRSTYEEDMPTELRHALETADAVDCYLCEKGPGNYRLLLDVVFDPADVEPMAVPDAWQRAAAGGGERVDDVAAVALAAAERLAAAHPELDVAYEHFRKSRDNVTVESDQLHVFMPWDTPREKAREIAEEVEREAFAPSVAEERRGAARRSR